MTELFECKELYRMESGWDVDPETGLRMHQPEHPECATHLLPFAVCRGDRLAPARTGIRYKMYFYRPEIPGNLIHTYTYQPEANWSTWCPERSEMKWTDGEIILAEDGFLRVAVSLTNGETLPEGSTLQGYVSVIQAPRQEHPGPAWMLNAREALVHRTEEFRRKNDLVLLLLADTHYTVGGIWPDTLRSLKLAAEQLHPDGLVHLGDFTDGLLPGEYTRCLVQRMLTELETVCRNLWCCIGNHDRNYFRGNPAPLTRRESAKLYLKRKKPWYHVDFREKKLRLLFLDSFEPTERERYGFPDEEVRWLRYRLLTTPPGYKVLVFSHVPPMAEYHVWSETIRNEEPVFRLLERFHRRRRGAVLGWIHGHSHADQIVEKHHFPVIGIGCSKLEDFPDHKPEGSVTWKRERDTETQELWDLLLVHPDTGSLDFLRFGAGKDRHLERNKEKYDSSDG